MVTGKQKPRIEPTSAVRLGPFSRRQSRLAPQRPKTHESVAGSPPPPGAQSSVGGVIAICASWQDEVTNFAHFASGHSA
jgi:hypothetical protein